MDRAEDIAERLRALEARLRRAAEAAGRDPDGFRIVAVTKTHPIETCRAALAAGLPRLGENRVQEAVPKVAALPEAEWHLVGRLQSNKARRAVELFAGIHSVDSIGLLERVDRVAQEEQRSPLVLLQVNVSREQTKAGLAPANLADLRPPRLAAVRLAGVTRTDAAGDTRARAGCARRGGGGPGAVRRRAQ